MKLLTNIAPDRPEPLSLKSGSSGSLSVAGTPTTRHVSSPLTASALKSFNLLESLDDVQTNFDDAIRRSVSSPQCKYRFASPSPASPLQSPTLETYQIIGKGDGDIFGTVAKGNDRSDIATDITNTFESSRGRLSTIYETPGAHVSTRRAQAGVNRLSDADWQTVTSSEQQHRLTKMSEEETNGAKLLRTEYEEFLIDADEDSRGEFGLDTEAPTGQFALDPEDESDDEGGPPLNIPFDSLSSYVGSTEAGSVLETASNASDEDPSRNSLIQYSYASPTKQGITQHSNHSSVAVNYYRPLPLRHYDAKEGDNGDATCIHPAFRKGYGAKHALIPPRPLVSQTQPSLGSPFLESFLKHAHAQSADSVPPTPPSGTRTTSSTLYPSSGPRSTSSTVGPPPPLPIRSPLRSTPGGRRNISAIQTLQRRRSKIPVPSIRAASSTDGESSTSSRYPSSTSISADADNIAACTTTTETCVAKQTSPSPAPSLLALHTAISASHINTLFSMTHAQAVTLPSVDLTTLSHFERTWRKVNEGILLRVFGRVDVELDSEGVELVEGIGDLIGG
ncbi:hypothetical protein IAQ61_000930 [Plenodomus lingam]|uniref:uncharacterized protein n=1 Tax=Leptosphaeria maculans TaxID=5022 RepID=UPI003322139F|nr:hypothetical protein IAQ61_000930 [Plenodomus lingam]